MSRVWFGFVSLLLVSTLGAHGADFELHEVEVAAESFEMPEIPIFYDREKAIEDRVFYTANFTHFFQAVGFGSLSMRGYDSTTNGGTITAVTGCFVNESAFSRTFTATLAVEQLGSVVESIPFTRSFPASSVTCHTLNGFNASVAPGTFEIVSSYNSALSDNLFLGLLVTTDGQAFDVQVGNQRPPTVTTPQGPVTVRGVGLEYRIDVIADSPGTIGFDSSAYAVSESGGQAVVTVVRSGGTSGVATVTYSTFNGTGINGVDYQGVAGTLTWSNGESGAKVFTVPIFDDGVVDGDKVVNLELSNPVGVSLGTANATLTILDDEGAGCTPDADTLCLNENGRFRAEVTWQDFNGNSGRGNAFPIGLRDSGLFYFFAQDNIEMLLKVLDACGSEFDSYWVFYAATTNVGFVLTITDTQTGVVKTYSNSVGNPAAPELDTAAFRTCP